LVFFTDEMKLPFEIDKTWTLFLDRDGVINLHYPNDYVKQWDEFIFLENAVESINKLSHFFKRIIVVTNQQGVGKELMTQQDLDFIHEEMRKEIRKEGGNIHAVYAATGLASPDYKLRKPDIGMAIQATKDFEGLDLNKSIMVGDSITDLQFGRNAGMKTIYVGNINDLDPSLQHFADASILSLSELAAMVKPD
jgi:histidinol-phosphate phosphatase family protein